MLTFLCHYFFLVFIISLIPFGFIYLFIGVGINLIACRLERKFILYNKVLLLRHVTLFGHLDTGVVILLGIVIYDSTFWKL